MNKKVSVKYMLLFGIVCALICNSTAVVATQINAKDVGFTSNDETWKVNNVEDAVNDLYLNKVNQSNKYTVEQLFYVSCSADSVANSTNTIGVIGYNTLTIGTVNITAGYSNTGIIIYGIKDEQKTEIFNEKSTVTAAKTLNDVVLDISEYDILEIKGIAATAGSVTSASSKLLNCTFE